MTDYSLPKIAELFNRRDHTTVINALRKVEKQMVEKQSLFNQVSELTAESGRRQKKQTIFPHRIHRNRRPHGNTFPAVQKTSLICVQHGFSCFKNKNKMVQGEKSYFYKQKKHRNIDRKNLL